VVADVDPRAFFAEHGWLVVRGAVSPSRVAELEAAVDAIYNAYPAAPPGQVWTSPHLGASARLEVFRTFDAPRQHPGRTTPGSTVLGNTNDTE
jgi:hypothetical protein